MTYKYHAKRPYAITYKILICVGFLSTVGRWLSVFQQDFVIINAEVHSHIFKFSLSLIAYAGIGYSWLLFGVKFRFILALGVLLAAGNLACETLMGFMNTADIIDAVYGISGVLASFLYLFFTYKYGLMEGAHKNG